VIRDLLDRGLPDEALVASVQDALGERSPEQARFLIALVRGDTDGDCLVMDAERVEVRGRALSLDDARAVLWPGKRYNPNQPRDPGGEGGGRWIREGFGAALGELRDADYAVSQTWLDEVFTATTDSREKLKKGVVGGLLERVGGDDDVWVAIKALGFQAPVHTSPAPPEDWVSPETRAKLNLRAQLQAMRLNRELGEKVDEKLIVELEQEVGDEVALIRRADMEHGLSMFIRTWAQTSADEDVSSLTLQRAISDEFGVQVGHLKDREPRNQWRDALRSEKAHVKNPTTSLTGNPQVAAIGMWNRLFTSTITDYHPDAALPPEEGAAFRSTALTLKLLDQSVYQLEYFWTTRETTQEFAMYNTLNELAKLNGYVIQAEHDRRRSEDSPSYDVPVGPVDRRDRAKELAASYLDTPMGKDAWIEKMLPEVRQLVDDTLADGRRALDSEIEVATPALNKIRASYRKRDRAARQSQRDALAGARKVARAQYEMTQEWFAKHGATGDVRLYRGMQIPTPSAFSDGFLDRNRPFTSQPASSWSTREATARRFTGRDLKGISVLASATVPVNRVLATPFTGVGALPEQEVVVLGPPPGKTDQMAMWSWRHRTGPDNITGSAMEDAIRYRLAGLIGLEEIREAREHGTEIWASQKSAESGEVINVDELDHNADWTKQTWDLNGVENADDLRRFLLSVGSTVEHFVTLPIYALNVEALPWLAQLAADAKRYNPNQLRDPGGEGGGQWIRALVGSLDTSDPSMLHDLGPNGGRYRYRIVDKGMLDSYIERGEVFPTFPHNDPEDARMTIYTSSWPEPIYAADGGYIVQIPADFLTDTTRGRRGFDSIPLDKVRVSERFTAGKLRKLTEAVEKDRIDVLYGVQRKLGLPEYPIEGDDALRKVLWDGRYDVSLKGEDRGTYTLAFAPKVPADLEIKVFEKRKGGGRKFYDPRYAQPKVTGRDEESGMEFTNLVPTDEARSKMRLADVAKPEPGMLYRGMSNAEYRASIERGSFRSEGGYNLGPDQEGLTYFSPDLGKAGNYAAGFAPYAFKPTFTDPAYVVKVREPSVVSLNPDLPGEVGVPGEVPVSEVVAVFRGDPFVIDEGEIDVRVENGAFVEGARAGFGGSEVWTEIPVGKDEPGGAGPPRLKLKPDADASRPLTQRQAETKLALVVNDAAKFYGGRGDIEVRYEPEWAAAADTQARAFVPPRGDKDEVWYGEQVMGNVRDSEMGVYAFRQVAHEAIHAGVSGTPHTYEGIGQTVEEGGAEILSLWYWQHRGQPFDRRDAVKRNGRWTGPGTESLVASVAYRERVAEVMRRSASRVGWDREKVVADVLDAVRGDHAARLAYRDSSSPEFPLPEGVAVVSWAELDRDESLADGEKVKWAEAEALVGWLLTGVKRFDPGQLRDRLGRWTDEPGGGGRSWAGWPWRVRTGDTPRLADVPPERTEAGDFVLYHGTSEDGARAIESGDRVRRDDLGLVGVTTTPGAAQSFAARQHGPVLRLVIDKEWIAGQGISHEIGGSGHDQFLLGMGDGEFGGIPPEAIRSVERHSFEEPKLAGGMVTGFMRDLDLGALLVGGSVRDHLMGKPHNDEDFVVPGHTLDELRDKLAPHGSVTPLESNGRVLGLRFKPSAEYGDVPKEGVEIALPRTEVSTGPAHQDFDITIDPSVPVEEDLRRRDFTINAMAQDVASGEIIDPFGGRQDVNDRVIRTVSPDSFRDDPLRTLRALRFMSQLGFDLDPDTERQMTVNAPGVANVSGERVQKELDKLVMGGSPERALTTMRNTGVLRNALPELADTVGFEQDSKYHDLTVDEHIFRAAQIAADNGANWHVRMALLFHDSGKPEAAWRGDDGNLHFYARPDLGKRDHAEIGADRAEAAMRRMGYRRDDIVRVRKIIEAHMLRPGDELSPVKARRFVHKVGKDLALDVIEHRRADTSAKDAGDDAATGAQISRYAGQMDEFEVLVREALGDPTTVRELAINGSDLIDLGFEPGPEIGMVLDTMLRQVVGNPSLNNPEWLRAEAGRRLGKTRKAVDGLDAKGRASFVELFREFALDGKAWTEGLHPRDDDGRFRSKLGVSVFDHFAVEAGDDAPTVREGAKRALANIDKVHRFPEAPAEGDLPIGEMSRATVDFTVATSGVSSNLQGGIIGTRMPGGEIAYTAIELNEEGVAKWGGVPAATGTVAHEIGHYIDRQVLGDKRKFASDMAVDLAGDVFARRVLAVWNVMDAAKGSKAINDIELAQELGYVTVYDDGGKVEHTLNIPHEQKHGVRYLLSPSEVFARAYAQWIALRSGDTEMSEGLAKRAKPEYIYAQWQHDDFEPIAKAFDELAERGWVA